MRDTPVKRKIIESKEVIRKTKEIVYELLNEPMTDDQKEKVLELFRLLR